jgi:hypothetical protein
MSGQFYDNPQRTILHLDAQDVATGGDIATIVGPLGKVGRIRRFDVVTTTAFTVADSVLTLDTITPSLATPLSLTVAFTGSGAGDLTRATKAVTDATTDLPADSPLQLNSDGGSTAGAGSIHLEIDWY